MPRKGLGKVCPKLPTIGFNEAGAVMPRKGRRRGRWRGRWTCFNEAGAVMPRKVAGGTCRVRCLPWSASMRPGQ